MFDKTNVLIQALSLKKIQRYINISNTDTGILCGCTRHYKIQIILVWQEFCDIEINHKNDNAR